MKCVSVYFWVQWREAKYKAGVTREDTKEEVKKNNVSEDKERKHFRYKKKLLCIDALSMQILEVCSSRGIWRTADSLVWPKHRAQKDLMKDESGSIKKTGYGRPV